MDVLAPPLVPVGGGRRAASPDAGVRACDPRYLDNKVRSIVYFLHHIRMDETQRRDTMHPLHQTTPASVACGKAQASPTPTKLPLT